MTICTIIICTLVALGINFILFCVATFIALKGAGKALAEIIVRCEEKGELKEFIKEWAKNNK